MAIDYSNFKTSLENLETQNEHLLHLSPDYPSFVHEAMAESVIRRFEICYDTLWKVLRRHLIEELGIAESPTAPGPYFALLTRTAYWRRVLNSGSSTYELA